MGTHQVGSEEIVGCESAIVPNGPIVPSDGDERRMLVLTLYTRQYILTMYMGLLHGPSLSVYLVAIRPVA